MNRSIALLALAVSLWSTAVAAHEVDALGQRVSEVATGVTMGLLLHELGHAMIGELALPATGPEEDAVDEFSALAMSELAAGDTIDVATYSSLLWWHWAEKNEREGQYFAWHGEHAPDRRRFRHTFCVLFGANPTAYDRLADRVGVDQKFKSRCAADYERKKRAWESIWALRARHLGPDMPGAYPADSPGGRISLVFRDSPDEYAQFLRRLFEEALPAMLEPFSQIFVWPRDLLVEFKDCGELNAWYSPADGAVTMCYEFMRYATLVVLQADGISTAAVTQRGAAMGYVQGTWSARVVVASHPLDVTITYNRDQTYRIEEVWLPSGLEPGGLAARIEGTWAAVEGGTPKQLFIRRQPQQWLPQESCYYSQAACGSETRDYPAQIVDQAAMYIDGVIWLRAP